MGKLFLGEVNFSPVKQAISRQTQAVGAAIGLAKTGLQIFSLFQDTKFSEFQGDYSDLYAEYQSKIIAGVNNGSIVPDETGQIVFEEALLGDPTQGMIPSPAKSLREDFLEQVGGLAEKYPRNSKVRKFVESTAQDAANVVALKAQQAVVEKYARQREVDFAERLYPQVVDQAIAKATLHEGPPTLEDMKPVRDLIIASDWIGAERQGALLEIAKSEVTQGKRRQDVRDLVRNEGLSAGSTSIQEMLSSGEITETQADELRKVVENSATSATLFWIESARAAFDGLTNEESLTTSANEATENVPAAYRTPARNALITEHRIAIEDADRTADENFEDFFAENVRDPFKIEKELNGPGRVGMRADTYRTWQARTESLKRNAGTNFVSDPLALNELFMMSQIETETTQAEVRDKIVEFLNANRIDSEDANRNLNRSFAAKKLGSDGYRAAANMLEGSMKRILVKANTTEELESALAVQGQLSAQLQKVFKSDEQSDVIDSSGHSDIERWMSRKLTEQYSRGILGGKLLEDLGFIGPPKPGLSQTPGVVIPDEIPLPVVQQPTATTDDVFRSRFGEIRASDNTTQPGLEARLDENNVWHGSTDGGRTWMRLQDGEWVSE